MALVNITRPQESPQAPVRALAPHPVGTPRERRQAARAAFDKTRSIEDALNVLAQRGAV